MALADDLRALASDSIDQKTRIERYKEILAQLEADALDPSSRPRLADDDRDDED